MKLLVDDDGRSQFHRRKEFERHRYVLVKYVDDENWRWMFIYPSIDAYERGGEPQSYVFKYVTKTEYVNYRELKLFEEITHQDVLRGRV